MTNIPILKNQRGAMFGLDARIAIAILGALGVVVGTSIFLTIPQMQAKSLVQDIAAYRAAVEGMQYDTRKNISDIITTGGDADSKRFQALNDRSVVKPADQPRWMGPYLKTRTADSTVHENFGQISLIEAAKGDYTTTGCSSCSYWLQIDDVPENSFEITNEEIDGATETTPANEGKVRWSSGSIYIRLGNAL